MNLMKQEHARKQQEARQKEQEYARRQQEAQQ